jgi:hypothetical protein
MPTESAAELTKKYGGTSNAIRAMTAEGFTTGQIARALGKLYQHVRNVKSKPLKRQAPNNATPAASGTGDKSTEQK